MIEPIAGKRCTIGTLKVLTDKVNEIVEFINKLEPEKKSKKKKKKKSN